MRVYTEYFTDSCPHVLILFIGTKSFQSSFKVATQSFYDHVVDISSNDNDFVSRVQSQYEQKDSNISPILLESKRCIKQVCDCKNCDDIIKAEGTYNDEVEAEADAELAAILSPRDDGLE